MRRRVARGGRGGVRARFRALQFAAAITAGATEKRNPICTVALLSVLSSRRCRWMEKGGGGRFSHWRDASWTSVTEAAFVLTELQVWRFSAEDTFRGDVGLDVDGGV